ncbi:wolframin [Anopheles ziemanni]|uniref:wolframin n=1 Tax=Anopheles coustani TaxID=139045 RepID=UPI002658A4C2|nr:wolframin [Anopheles coustani]XP_058171690.1 wolframin [Anopheles ziemanni]
MASWANRPPIESNGGPSSTRKKWNLEDKKSLRNLKYHFAEDGCSEVQFTLAKQLLEENSETDPAHNHAQGVQWLLRAAQQGHEASIELLKECFENGRGITEANEEDVRSILAMSPSERSARRAAQELFASLSNGEEYVTAAQLEKRMREIYKIDRRRRRTQPDGAEADGSVEHSASASGTPERPGGSSTNHDGTPLGSSNGNRLHRSPTVNHISEANLLAAAVNYSNGHLPAVSDALMLSVPDPHSLNHVPCFHRPFFHPIVFFQLLYHRFLLLMSTFPGSTGGTWLQLVLVLATYWYFASENFLSLVPVGGYYASLAVMVLCSFRMLKSKHDFIDFRMWSGLFLRYGDEHLNTNEPENQYLRNNLKPYLYFFVAFFVNMMLQPNISDQWLPFSEITVLAFTLTFLTMFAFTYTAGDPFPDYLILFSFGLNVLAKYPYEMDEVVTTGWRFLDLKVPGFSTFVIGNGIEFCLNCRAMLYLMIPGFLMYLARRNSWRGIYQYLMPHCVTLAWLQICIISSQSATMFGLVRGALGLSGLLLFLPLFGIVTLLIPVFAVIEWLSLTDSTVRLWSSIGAAVTAVAISGYMASSRRTERYITFLQIAICVIGTVFLTLPHMMSNFETVGGSEGRLYESTPPADHLGHHHRNPSHTKDSAERPASLSWDLYYKFCHQPAWDSENKVKTQLRCTNLDGTYVRWEGTVLDMAISSRRNLRAELIEGYLPKFLADRINCLYGEPIEPDCGNLNGSSEGDCENLKHFMQRQRTCHLNKWNTYEYELKVRMSTGLLTKPAEIVLKAQHAFGNFTQSLNYSDRIWFIGVLRDSSLSQLSAGGTGPATDQQQQQWDSAGGLNLNLGGHNFGVHGMRLGRKNPLLELHSIGCIQCRNPTLTAVHLTEGLKVNGRMRDLLRGVKYLLNVIFNPLVIFK